jgi:hypothetical protein
MAQISIKLPEETELKDFIQLSNFRFCKTHQQWEKTVKNPNKSLEHLNKSLEDMDFKEQILKNLNVRN